VQNVEIVDFGSKPPTTGSNFSPLLCLRGVSCTNVVEFDTIDVYTGDHIGVFGARGTTQMIHSEAYSRSGPFYTTFSGYETALNPMYVAVNLYSTEPSYVQAYSDYTNRVELWYESHDTCPPPPPGGAPQAVAWNVAAYGACWYVGNPGNTCDQTCTIVGGTNLAEMVAGRWPDTCASPDSQDITTMFHERGNLAKWTSGSATGGHTLGYGYTGGGYYGSCVSGSTSVGSFPGDTNSSSTRTVACPCFRRKTFGPTHTFNGISIDWMYTFGTCSPTHNVDSDADWFCQAMYGPRCVARPGYYETGVPANATEILRNAVSSNCYRGTSIPSTWGTDGPLVYSSEGAGNPGITNLTCDCY